VFIVKNFEKYEIYDSGSAESVSARVRVPFRGKLKIRGSLTEEGARVEVSVSSGSGKLRTAGGVNGVTKESISRAFTLAGQPAFALELAVQDQPDDLDRATAAARHLGGVRDIDLSSTGGPGRHRPVEQRGQEGIQVLGRELVGCSGAPERGTMMPAR
jgi:hypothetical protein